MFFLALYVVLLARGLRSDHADHGEREDPA